jgi:hypothetical protein
MKLWEAREKTFATARAVKGGTDCLLCGQLVKVYPRNIGSTIARCLVELERLGGDERYVSVIEINRRVKPEMKKNSNPMANFSMLRYWELVVEKPNPDDPSKRTSGLWMLTKRGKRFLDGAPEPRYCYVLVGAIDLKTGNNGFSEETRNIDQCLGDKFSRKELLSTPIHEVVP